MTTANTKITTATAKPTGVVEKLINEKRLRDTDNTVMWTVVGLPDCEWAQKSINLLSAHKEQVKLIIMNAEWQRRLVVEFGTRRSPAIFKGATYFGSHDALENYYKCNFFSDHEII